MNYTVSKILRLGPMLQARPAIRACSGKTPAVPEENTLRALHRVSNLERKFLVWTKKYKSTKEVPNFVGQNVMERARNRMRIKIANYMMGATVLGCCLMIYLGKQDKKEGKSVTKMNMDWHRQVEEEDEKRKAALAQKTS